MREILFRGKRVDHGGWVYGHYVHQYGADMIYLPNGTDREYGFDYYHIDKETLCEYTGLTDKNGKRIFEGDIVEFLGSKYEVVFECGTFGIAGVSDWEAIEKQIPISTGCDNDLHACLNDNYISLWEIHWNLENNHEVLDTVKIIGNIHNNGELLTEERSENENQ